MIDFLCIAEQIIHSPAGFSFIILLPILSITWIKFNSISQSFFISLHFDISNFVTFTQKENNIAADRNTFVHFTQRMRIKQNENPLELCYGY